MSEGNFTSNEDWDSFRHTKCWWLDMGKYKIYDGRWYEIFIDKNPWARKDSERGIYKSVLERKKIALDVFFVFCNYLVFILVLRVSILTLQFKAFKICAICKKGRLDWIAKGQNVFFFYYNFLLKAEWIYSSFFKSSL